MNFLIVKLKGDDDCGDSSDEPETCTSRVCSANYFKCSTGRCIPLRYKLFIQFFFSNDRNSNVFNPSAGNVTEISIVSVKKTSPLRVKTNHRLVITHILNAITINAFLVCD